MKQKEKKATNLYLDIDIHEIISQPNYITVPDQPYLKFKYPKDVVEFLVKNALINNIIKLERNEND